MYNNAKRMSHWVVSVILILFLLGVVVFPLVVGNVYASTSGNPDHVLTYTQGKLTWDSATKVDANGVVELSFFNAAYENVKSSDGENVVAPGTEKTTVIRLANDVSGNVNYTAVLYSISTNEDIPVTVSMTGEGLAATSDYSLPQGVTSDNVLQAVKGSVAGGKIQDFDVNWQWKLDGGEEQDAIDTALGTAETADDISVGMYIVVEDGNDYVAPSTPGTGDQTQLVLYISLLCVSAAVLVFLLVNKNRKKVCED